jgi:hypothetical protein
MAQFRVDSDIFELPRNSFFTTIPIADPQGRLCQFDFGGVPIVGRLVGDEIIIPGLQIVLTGKITVRCLGAVVPMELDFREMTDLPDIERVMAEEVPRHRR